MPDAIIIGIPNIDRGFDFDPNQNAYKFLDFITKELATYIEIEYRTNGDRLLCGYSLGGTFAIFALLNASESFRSYIAGSPYRLDIFSESEIDNLADRIQDPKNLYTSMGENDRENQMEFFLSFCKKMDMADINNFSFKYEVIPNRNHDNSFMINWVDGLGYIMESYHR